MEKSKIIEFRNDLEGAVKKVAEKYGYEFGGLGKITYNDGGMKSCLEVTFNREKKLERENLRARMRGNPEIGSIVEFKGRMYEVTGYTSKGVMIGRDMDGKEWRFPKAVISKVEVQG